jgi:hypothetical protein
MCNPLSIWHTECSKVLQRLCIFRVLPCERQTEWVRAWIFYRVKQWQYHQEPRRLGVRNTMVLLQSSSTADDMPFCMCLDWTVARHMIADPDHCNLAKSAHLHKLCTNWIYRNTGVGRLTANLGSLMPWSCPDGSRHVIDKILKEISPAICIDSETRKKPHKAQNAPTGDYWDREEFEGVGRRSSFSRLCKEIPWPSGDIGLRHTFKLQGRAPVKAMLIPSKAF